MEPMSSRHKAGAADFFCTRWSHTGANVYASLRHLRLARLLREKFDELWQLWRPAFAQLLRLFSLRLDGVVPLACLRLQFLVRQPHFQVPVSPVLHLVEIGRAPCR